MQEVFSTTDGPGIPMRDQEFYELQLSDSDDTERPGHVVMQSRATWSEPDGHMMWDEIEVERFSVLEVAKERYAVRRAKLANKGFVLSDMDF